MTAALCFSPPPQPSKRAEAKAKKAAPAQGDASEPDVEVPPTPAGEKKILGGEMAKAYSPAAVEAS